MVQKTYFEIEKLLMIRPTRRPTSGPWPFRNPR